MINALLKKQFLEIFSFIYISRKSGESRSLKGIIGFGLLYLYVFGIIFYMFWNVSDFLCEPLLSVNLEWLYITIMSLLATVLGVFGSVFNTYSSLYTAKDNDLLFAMPISSAKILGVRLVGVYILGLLYELIVMIPAFLVYFMNAKLGIAGYVFSVLIPFMLSFFILILSCVLGFVVALVSTKIKNKSFITVLLSLGFIAGYYYILGKATDILQMILLNPVSIGKKVKNILYLFYHMGIAAGGNAISMLIVFGIITTLFVLIYTVLSRSFIKIATTNKGSTKIKYKEKNIKIGKPESALFKKELKRFLSSSTYMLNCGLGIVLMPLAAVMLVIKGGDFAEIISMLSQKSGGIISLIAVAAICMITSMNDITAPSVSLEGKNIWLVKSYPIAPIKVFLAKLKLHLILTVIPSIFLIAAVISVLKPSLYFTVMIPVSVLIFIAFSAIFGLFLNLKFPNLEWTNEVVPIKQSMSVTLSLFGGWAVIIAFGAIYLGLDNFINPSVYLIMADVILLTASCVLFGWIKHKGTKIFERL